MIAIASDTLVSLYALYNSLTGDYVNDATVSGVLKDADGEVLSSFSLTATGTGGNYNGVIPASVTDDLTEGGIYTVAITAVSGSNQRVFQLQDVASYS